MAAGDAGDARTSTAHHVLPPGETSLGEPFFAGFVPHTMMLAVRQGSAPWRPHDKVPFLQGENSSFWLPIADLDLVAQLPALYSLDLLKSVRNGMVD